MSYAIQVFLKNNSFSEEYALEKHEGKDSPENIRFEWEDEFRLTGNHSFVEVLRDQTYDLAGEKADGTLFSFAIPNLMRFVFQSENGSVSLVFSEKAVDEYIVNMDAHKLIVYLNDLEVVENPTAGVYVVLSDFPSELRG
jgi:hypothetical protein